MGKSEGRKRERGRKREEERKEKGMRRKRERAGEGGRERKREEGRERGEKERGREDTLENLFGGRCWQFMKHQTEIHEINTGNEDNEVNEG